MLGTGDGTIAVVNSKNFKVIKLAEWSVMQHIISPSIIDQVKCLERLHHYLSEEEGIR